MVDLNLSCDSPMPPSPAAQLAAALAQGLRDNAEAGNHLDACAVAPCAERAAAFVGSAIPCIDGDKLKRVWTASGPGVDLLAVGVFGGAENALWIMGRIRFHAQSGKTETKLRLRVSARRDVSPDGWAGAVAGVMVMAAMAGCGPIEEHDGLDREGEAIAMRLAECTGTGTTAKPVAAPPPAPAAPPAWSPPPGFDPSRN